MKIEESYNSPINQWGKKKKEKEMLGKVGFLFFRNTNGCLQELVYTKINISFKPLLGRIQKARHDKPSQKTRSYIG